MDGSKELSARASQKAFRHLIFFLFLCYVVAYLDRVNIGFAALSMNKDLGLTAAAFGLANTIFYIGYFVCEVPSNLLMVRVGARRWIARIMVSWGLASMLTVLAVGPWSLYSIRLLVGITEAGFVPGVLLYLTYWFPQEWRGRATATFMIAQPIALGFGSLVSGFIMSGTEGFLGMVGWKWLFILEGLPAVVMGVIVWFYLPDGPATAKWLEPAEKAALEAELATGAPPAAHDQSDWLAVWSWPFAQLMVAYFGLVTSLNALATWSPLIIREALGTTTSVLIIGLLSALPGIAAAIFMPIWGASSDRRSERKLHYAIPVAMAVVGWLCVAGWAWAPGRVFGLILCTAGGFCGMSILWTLPPAVLNARTRPLGIAILSCAGIAGSITSPSIIGFLRDSTGSFAAGAWYAAIVLVVSIICIALIPVASYAMRPTAAVPSRG